MERHWTEVAEQVVAWACAAAGFAVAVRKHIAKLMRAVYVADSIHAQFGPEAAATLRAITDDLSRSRTVQEFRHRLAERHLRIGIYVCSPCGKCTWCNEWLAEAFGIDRADMNGLDWLRGIEAGDGLRAADKWVHAVAHGIPYQDEYKVHNTRTGKDWIAVTEAFAIQDDGVVACYVGYVVPKGEGPGDSDVTRA